jgi:hypothetical protein
MGTTVRLEDPTVRLGVRDTYAIPSVAIALHLHRSADEIIRAFNAESDRAFRRFLRHHSWWGRRLNALETLWTTVMFAVAAGGFRSRERTGRRTRRGEP